MPIKFAWQPFLSRILAAIKREMLYNLTKKKKRLDKRVNLNNVQFFKFRKCEI